MMSIGEDGSLLEQLKEENIEKNQITNVQMKKTLNHRDIKTF